MFKVDAIPGEPQNFSLPNPCKQSDLVQGFMRASFDSIQKRRDMCLIQGMSLFLYNSWKIISIGGVTWQTAKVSRLLERFMQNPMDIPNRFGGKAQSPVLLVR